MFRVAAGTHQVNYAQKCRKWFAREMERKETLRSSRGLMLPCPCDLRLAMMDRRWRFDGRQSQETGNDRRCIYERIPWTQSTRVRTKTNQGPCSSRLCHIESIVHFKYLYNLKCI